MEGGHSAATFELPPGGATITAGKDRRIDESRRHGVADVLEDAVEHADVVHE